MDLTSNFFQDQSNQHIQHEVHYQKPFFKANLTSFQIFHFLQDFFSGSTRDPRQIFQRHSG